MINRFDDIQIRELSSGQRMEPQPGYMLGIHRSPGKSECEQHLTDNRCAHLEMNHIRTAESGKIEGLRDVLYSAIL